MSAAVEWLRHQVQHHQLTAGSQLKEHTAEVGRMRSYDQ